MGYDPYREEADEMARGLVLSLPGLLATVVCTSIGFASHQWVMAGAAGVATLAILGGIVILILRWRRRGGPNGR